MITPQELTQKYLDFFKERGHEIIPAASLIPENDPTVLFTTAGMHPLVPYLLGAAHPSGTRLVNVQKCVRTGDIDDVGDDTHLTFFEMLGNWSLGDYFKNESIPWSWEFLTDPKWLGIPKERLSVTYFKGDENAPEDLETKKIWLSLGLPEHRITPLSAEDNWWPTALVAGPCGPDTEIFYWRGENEPPADSNPGNDKTWVEIWNNVFMQFKRLDDNSLQKLEKPNVDTGMGLERTVAILDQKKSVYEVSPLKDIIHHVTAVIGLTNVENALMNRHLRIIADHMRAATFIIGDQKGVGPSNVGQGYVVRKLLRRAMLHAKLSGMSDFDDAHSLWHVSEYIIGIYGERYPELIENELRIRESVQSEEQKYAEVLRNAESLAKAAVDHAQKDGRAKVILGRMLFDWQQSHGVEPAMVAEMIPSDFVLDMEGYEFAMNEHKELSRKNAPGQFKGGLGGHSEMETRLHTATHLLHRALQLVLGSHVAQKGSNITPERLRFDFSHPAKMTPEEIQKVEALVNEQILANIPVICETMAPDAAKASGAIGLFDLKYAEAGGQVTVYTVGSFSKEICGGPHVSATGELGKFKILKEEASSQGVRRIKAILE